MIRAALMIAALLFPPPTPFAAGGQEGLVECGEAALPVCAGTAPGIARTVKLHF